MFSEKQTDSPLSFCETLSQKSREIRLVSKQKGHTETQSVNFMVEQKVKSDSFNILKIIPLFMSHIYNKEVWDHEEQCHLARKYVA